VQKRSTLQFIYQVDNRDVAVVVLQDLCNMVKARLLKAQFPESF
jgi:hypothetical protein